jgi:DNA end-binding protein Ku
VSDRELLMAKQLIESLTNEFAPERFHDDYREKVLELIEQKAAGVETVIEAPAAVEETKVVDLLAALEASVKEARDARKRHPAAGDDGAETEPAEASKPKKRAKKSA